MARKISDDERLAIAKRWNVAYSSLDRPGGELPTLDELEKKYEITQGFLGKLLAAERTRGDVENFEKALKAFNTTKEWVNEGRGGHHILSGRLYQPRRRKSGNHVRIPQVAIDAREEFERIHKIPVEPDWMERAAQLASTYVVEQPREWWVATFELCQMASQGPLPTSAHLPRVRRSK